MSEETWPCPERAAARIRAIVEAANREIGGIVAGVKLALEIPDTAALDLERGLFVLPPRPGADGHVPELAKVGGDG